MTTDHMDPKTSDGSDWPDNKVEPGGDIMLRVAGKRFRCSCGGNVFQHPPGEPDIYRCNSCGTEYEAGE